MLTHKTRPCIAYWPKAALQIVALVVLNTLLIGNFSFLKNAIYLFIRICTSSCVRSLYFHWLSPIM